MILWDCPFFSSMRRGGEVLRKRGARRKVMHLIEVSSRTLELLLFLIIILHEL
jgi:hypothetical protein